MDGPEYVCGLLHDPQGRWLLQLRPALSRIAANRLTCFGGRRRPGESRRDCLHRELQEELGWCPERLAEALELWQGGRWIASFLAATVTLPLCQLRLEPDQVAILAPSQALPGLPLSPWHARVLTAHLAGRTRVDLAAED